MADPGSWLPETSFCPSSQGILGYWGLMNTNPNLKRPRCKKNSSWLSYSELIRLFMCITQGLWNNSSWARYYFRQSKLYSENKRRKNRPSSSYYEDSFLSKAIESWTIHFLTPSELFILPWQFKENARRDHRQKEFSPLTPVVWQKVQINSSVGSIGYSLGIHQQYVIHFVWNTCMQVARELSSLPSPGS